jgi:hypothetical protein
MLTEYLTLTLQRHLDRSLNIFVCINLIQLALICIQQPEVVGSVKGRRMVFTTSSIYLESTTAT